MKPKQFLLLPVMLLLVVSVSGCTGISSIDSLFGGFCIPGLTCGSTTKDTSDIIVISSFDANPSTVSTGQQFRLSAWILNQGGETVPQKSFQEGVFKGSIASGITVELFDTCEGLFKEIKVTCPDSISSATEGSKGCVIKSILPGQSIPISWTITANGPDKVPLEIPCTIKAYVRYPYRTQATTTFAFVDYIELQRMRESGTTPTTTSDIHLGPGPIKPYLLSEDTQPIPVANNNPSKTTVSFQIKNEGSGFLFDIFESEKGIRQEDITVESNPTEGGYQIGDLINDALQEQTKNGVELIGGKQSPKYMMSIDAPYKNKIEKIATYPVITTIDYMYEFRKEVKVTVKPPKITG